MSSSSGSGSGSGLPPSPLTTRVRYLENVARMNTDSSTDGTWNGLQLDEQRSIMEMNRMMNQFGQLQVNRDTNSVLQNVAASHQNGPSADAEELKELLKKIIHDFVTRPGRKHSYNTTMRWTIGNDPQTSYNVVVIINHPFK
jgi:hypothetical protein